MGLLGNLKSRFSQVARQYSGDTVFLHAVASAAANVTAADGQIDDAEIETAIAGMMANEVLKASYSASQIEEEVGNALRRAKTRAGRIENTRFIEAIATRPVELRQDCFLIGADVADNGGIGREERTVLDAIAKALNVDAAKLLG